MGQFPINVGISEVRGIIEIVKDNGNALSLSKLAEEAEEEVDKLLPLLDAAEMLGLCTVENGTVKLTSTGIGLTQRNAPQVFAKALSGIEPFKSVMDALSQGPLTSSELAAALKGKNIILYADDVTNMEMLRNLLLKWGVRSKIVSYSRSDDLWSIPPKH
ncbi:MAG: AAA-associated domain-containing protein [Candidatus Marsarchaeota archaeon]|nr:AAA-associated domain-containing protein [Candidatus Marsarchaeota archaeon]MCL5418454.1 AAA-associated domain-containing protein [Candidatus Marsarchaeota archaeon]